MRTRLFFLTRCFLIFIFFVGLPCLWALELKEGRLKLVLHEGIGRFSLYSLDQSKQNYIPLFIARDPRTSGISLVVDDKIVHLGETSEYKETIEEFSNNPAFVWVSKKIKIVQSFEFVSSVGSSVRDGVKIVLRLNNISTKETSVGVRFCLDTYLGEESQPHFRTDQNQEINRELSINKDNMVRYWMSLSKDSTGLFGLQSVTSGGGITPPERIVFANWKRLTDSTWLYNALSTRNFNLLPYSINDSAVCQYYAEEPLKRGETREITLILGNYNPKGYVTVAKISQTPLSKQRDETGAETDISAPAELKLVNDLLDEVDKRLNSSGTVSAEDVQVLIDILTGLKSRLEALPQN